MKKRDNSRLLIIETAEKDIILKLESLEETNNELKESITISNKELEKIRNMIRNI